MLAKISVLVPTRNRLDRLRTMLRSYSETSRDDFRSSELVFRVDEDDPGTRDFLLDGITQKVFVGPREAGYSSMGTYFNEMLGLASGDVLMIGNDDMVFRTQGWASLILAEANRHQDEVFDVGVSTFNEDHWPFAIVSRKMVDALGFLWDPRIYWGDIFLRDVAGTFGRSVKLPSVVIDHDWAGNAPDATFLEGNQTDIYRRDPTYWIGTHARCVAEAVERLRPLVGAA